MGRSVANATSLPSLGSNAVPSLRQLVPPALRTPAGSSLTNQRTTTLLPNAPKLPENPYANAAWQRQMLRGSWRR